MRESSWIEYSTTARVATNAEKVPEETEQEIQNAQEYVRVTVQIEAGEVKEDVIGRISKEVFGDSELDIQNEKIAEDMFTANIPSDKLEAVKAVSGVKDVTLVEADQLMEEEQEQSQNLQFVGEEQEQSQDSQELEEEQEKSQDSQTLQKENNIEISHTAVVGLVILIFILLLLVGKKLHKKFR